MASSAPPTTGRAWTEQIPDDEWAIYQRVVAEARAEGVNFALGGAFAVAAYTGFWRNTKDLDFYVVPAQRDAMIAAVTRAGLADYYWVQPYDRGWIYRAHQGDIIADVIWAMANRRALVDEAWITRGREVAVRGQRVRAVAAEEMIWAKLYILHRDRCDWPDVLNLIYAVGAELDWARLLGRLGDDARLLAGVLSVYLWLCPGRSRALPGWLWTELHLPPPPAGPVPDVDWQRVRWIDVRPWFGPDRADRA